MGVNDQEKDQEAPVQMQAMLAQVGSSEGCLPDDLPKVQITVLGSRTATKVEAGHDLSATSGLVFLS